MKRIGITSTLCALSLWFVPTLLGQVSSSELENRDNVWYLKGSETPYSGAVLDEGQRGGELVDGVRVGRWTTWNGEGNVSSISDYNEGEMHFHAMYHSNGNKRFEGSFANGRPDGQHQTWYASGVQQAEVMYAKGRRHGPYTLWDLEGHVLYTAEYSSGQLDGPAIWWYQNGEKRWATSYKKGERWGIWTQWDTRGRILMQSDWKDGQLIARR